MIIKKSKQKYNFPRALGRLAAPSLSDESVLFAFGETMLKRFHKLRKIIFLFGLVIIFLLLTAVPASAQVIGNWEFLNGIVPCGTSYANTPCTVCHFYKLLQNIINFLLLTSASLVTLMAIIIGFLFLFSGGSPQKITDAKSKLWLLVWGLVWVLGSWLVLNTIINFITVIGKSRDFPMPWNQISCQVSQSSGGVSPGGENPGGNAPPFQPGGGEFGGGGASGSWDEVRPAAVERLDGGVYDDGIDTSTAGYEQLNEEHYGLEQVEPAVSYTAITPINPAVNQEVQQVDTRGVNPNLVKAIIQAESNGNPNAVHLDSDGKSSYGLMQVRPDTAKNYDPSLKGLTDAQIGERLKNPEYNIKLGTAYLEDLAAKYNGDLNKVIAAYNGGPGANGPSRDCPGSLRWQCQWDNQAHTVPNTGYAVTRNYVVSVNQYYSQINK